MIKLDAAGQAMVIVAVGDRSQRGRARPES
jgi:hypothetical protein